MQDGGVKGPLISALSGLASPEQRDGLAAELTKALITTQDSNVASAAARVLKDFNYRKARPYLMQAVQTASGATASEMAYLLTSLTPPEAKEREQLSALMTTLFCRTADTNLASAAAATIKEFGYKKAGPHVAKVLCETTNSSMAYSAADVLKALDYREASSSLREALKTAPLDIAAKMAGLLVQFQDKKAVGALRSRLYLDRGGSSGSIVQLGRSLYDLQGPEAKKLLIQCAKDAQSQNQAAWTDFFKEKGIVGAQAPVQPGTS